jgi:hypothetical protein
MQSPDQRMRRRTIAPVVAPSMAVAAMEPEKKGARGKILQKFEAT